MAEPVRLWDLVRGGAIGVELWCNSCGHHGILETDWLIDRLGTYWPVIEVANKCRCSQCGSRDVESQPNWSSDGPGVITNHGPTLPLDETDDAPPY